MYGTLQSIGITCQGLPPMGWLTHVYLVNCDDAVFDIYPGDTLYAEHPLFLQNAKIVTEIRLRTKTASFAETQQSSGDGESYNSQLSIPVPAIAREVAEWVYQNEGRRFIAIFRDTAGNCYMGGRKSNGMRLSWNRSVVATISHQLQLTGREWHPVKWLGTVELEALFPVKEFDYSFEISFS